MTDTLAELKREFADPQAEYGPIDCWWWEAARLDKTQMRWQLEELVDKGVAGTWYYPRYIGDEPLGSRPRYWTEEWWELTEFAIEEHARLGLHYWFSDWTAHEFIQDRLRAETAARPEFKGKRILLHEREVADDGSLTMALGPGEVVLDAAAFRANPGGLDYTTRVDLSAQVRNGRLYWEPGEPGWTVTLVCVQPFDLDYLNAELTGRWIEILLGAYESRVGAHMGRTIKAFGTDEWRFMEGNILYSSALTDRFRAEKGYDPAAYLVGLFRDIGQPTDKIRCQYYEVMGAEIVEKFYRPFAAWLEQRNMQFTEFCPRGKSEDLLEQTHHYGDFFRYMGNYHIPGNEERCLRGDRVRKFQAKLASSIAHMNGRQRVGLCAYWGSGWGHTTQENLAWTNENYAYGINLYNRHGVLYSTMAGWYEWVPPAVHFRQPYWKYWRTFTDYVRRLSYLLSQGTHRADVALLYPLATLHAHWEDRLEFDATAAKIASEMYQVAKVVYRSGIDLDFVDDTAMAAAGIEDGKLVVSGMPFRAVLLPPMTTIRLATMRLLADFYGAGGTVAAYGRLPTASDENGRDDPELAVLIEAIFGPVSGADMERPSERERAIFAPADMELIPRRLAAEITRDLVASQPHVFHTHQVVDGHHVYYVYNHCGDSRRIELDIDAAGAPQRWDAQTGEVFDLHRFAIVCGRTRVVLNMDPYEATLLVFGGGDERPEVVDDNLGEIESVDEVGGQIRVSGSAITGGTKKIRLRYGGREYAGETEAPGPPPPVALDGSWGFHLEPTMNNRWGDYRYPAGDRYIGAEVRRFRYREEGRESGEKFGWHEREFDDADWQRVTYSHGPYWWSLGPIRATDDGPEIAQQLSKAASPSDTELEIGPTALQWERYRFSKKFGFEKGESAVTADERGSLMGVQPRFLRFPAVEDAPGAERVDFEAALAAPEARAAQAKRAAAAGARYVRYLLTSITVDRAGSYTFDLGGQAALQRQAWVDGEEVLSVAAEEAPASRVLQLDGGSHALLVRLEVAATEPVETYAILYRGEPPAHDPLVPQLPWFDENAPEYEISPGRSPVGWYRFEAPPGLRGIRLNCDAEEVEAWVNGEPIGVAGERAQPAQVVEKTSKVALRVRHRPAAYEGAAFPEPVAFECEPGTILAGDWCDHGLAEYSGGGIYRRTIRLNESHLSGRVLLDLGSVVATAAVRVNGEEAGVRMALPFRFDISDLVVAGDNELEITVVNTLANHMSSYPTNFIYPGQLAAGMLGPVRLEFHSSFEISAAPV